MTEEQARKTFERAQKTEQEFSEYFTGEQEPNPLLLGIKYCHDLGKDMTGRGNLTRLFLY